jgi:hypothetical protein
MSLEGAGAASVSISCAGPNKCSDVSITTFDHFGTIGASVIGRCGSGALFQTLTKSTNIGPHPALRSLEFGFLDTLLKINPSTEATFEIKVFLRDRVSTCLLDPLMATLTINTGRVDVETFSDISQTEHFINVTNGNPGLNQVAIRVNGKPYKNLQLGANTNGINLDASSVMTLDENTLTFISRGDVGSFANILIADTLTGDLPAATQKVDWGRSPTDTVEDNASDQSAMASTQQINLSFATSLNQGSAQDAQRYSVMVNGAAASVAQVAAQPSAGNTTVVLTLAPQSLAVGNAVEVNWEGLKNAAGKTLSGHVDLVAE